GNPSVSSPRDGFARSRTRVRLCELRYESGGPLNASTKLAAALTVTVALSALAGGVARARTAGSCGVVSAAHHQWIVVANGISCPGATGVVQHFATRTAALANGAKVTVSSPLRGYTCALASHGHPAGSCATPGAAKSIVWIIAA